MLPPDPALDVNWEKYWTTFSLKQWMEIPGRHIVHWVHYISQNDIINYPTFPPPLLAATHHPWRQGGTARGSCPRAEGAAAETRWLCAQEEQRRRRRAEAMQRRGGRGIYFCVSFLSCQKSNSPAEEETTRFRDGADLFPLPFTVTVFNGAFLFIYFLNGRTDQTNHGVWVEDSRGRSTPLPEMSLLCVGGKRGNERGRESLPVSCYWSITNCTSCLTEPAGYQLPAKVCMCMRVCVPSYCAE